MDHANLKNNPPTEIEPNFYNLYVKDLPLNPRFNKLIIRVRKILPDLNTIKELLELNPEIFSKINGIGKTYVDLLRDLQKEVPTVLSALQSNLIQEGLKKSQYEQAFKTKYTINHGFLNSQEQKLLNKIRKFFKTEITTNFLINLDPKDFNKIRSVGRKAIITLVSLQERIRKEVLERYLNNETSVPKSSLCTLTEYLPLQPEVIERILIEDFEHFLSTLDNVELQIALGRWGYNEPRQSLESLGKIFGFTRERVRQLETNINEILPLSTRVHPQILKKNIQPYFNINLAKVFPNLSQYFYKPDIFFAFLELYCEVREGSLLELQRPYDLSARLVEEFFSITPSPTDPNEFLEEVMSSYGQSRLKAEGCLEQLKEDIKIKLLSGKIIPQNMTKKSAIAHALLEHPKGLPWIDVANIVNANGFSKKKLPITRLDGAFLTSEFVYLFGRGTYRHMKYFDFPKNKIDEVLKITRKYLHDKKLQSANLQNIHNFLNTKIKIGYFDLRYLVSNFGEEEEIYFEGQSGVDTVNLSPDKTHVKLTETILHTLKEAQGALTIAEIAEQLKSKSINLAAFNVNKLLDKGLVVRVDLMMYTTPEKAFAGIDSVKIGDIINGILQTSDKPVESDMFREYINSSLGLSYSKHFYRALGKFLAKKYRWHVKRGLFSTKPIEYEGLSEIFRTFFDSSLSNSENLERIRKAVIVTDHVAKRLLLNWMSGLRNDIGNAKQ